MERRNIKRHYINASTACGHFSASKHRKTYEGKMLNYSADGMCIESNADFKEGSIVMIKVNTPLNNADHPIPVEGFRTVSLAEIKWSKPLDYGGKALFGMCGLKYLY
jgi:hypothetical protein